MCEESYLLTFTNKKRGFTLDKLSLSLALLLLEPRLLCAAVQRTNTKWKSTIVYFCCIKMLFLYTRPKNRRANCLDWCSSISKVLCMYLRCIHWWVNNIKWAGLLMLGGSDRWHITCTLSAISLIHSIPLAIELPKMWVCVKPPKSP